MTTERPNTVAGLLAKRAELATLRTQLESELKAVTFDLDHLDACIRLFDPEGASPVRSRYRTQHHARAGQLARFALDQLRAAPEPLTVRQIALAWADANGIEPAAKTLAILNKRTASCLLNLRRRGRVENASVIGGAKVWRLKER